MLSNQSPLMYILKSDDFSERLSPLRMVFMIAIIKDSHIVKMSQFNHLVTDLLKSCRSFLQILHLQNVLHFRTFGNTFFQYTAVTENIFFPLTNVCTKDYYIQV